MKTAGVFFAFSSLFFSMAAAAPLQHKRDIVWETVWTEITETVPCTTTIYVDGDNTAAAAAPTNPAAQFFQAPKPAPAPAPSSYATPAAAPAQSSPPPAPYVAPASSPSPAPPSSPAPYVSPAAVNPSPSPAPAYTPPPASPQPPAYTPPSSSPTPSPASSSGSSGGPCTPGSPCQGDLTFYNTGLGSCGIESNDSQDVVALPHGLMGEQSNGNPYCGRKIRVMYGEKHVDVIAVDKCMGCSGDSLDLSPHAFNAICDSSLGRVEGSWYFL